MVAVTQAPRPAGQARTVAHYLTRRAGRVVLIEPKRSVLLLSGTDPSDATAPPFWFVPGGGAENDETPEQAARREVYEEVGARLEDLGPPVWHRHVSFPFGGDWYDQYEWFFVVRVARFDPRAAALTELERRATTGARWWPLAELAETEEAVHPAGLAWLVTEWLANGPPAQPRSID